MSDSDMQAAMRQVQEATNRIRSGESDAEEVVLPNGGVFRIFREDGPSGRVVVESRRSRPQPRQTRSARAWSSLGIPESPPSTKRSFPYSVRPRGVWRIDPWSHSWAT